MMFVINALTTVLALFSLVHASPLARRDVIAPKITSPNGSTQWTVGAVETVTWDTSNFPPDSQITNPIGKVILGFDENDSLNLDFEHPLAEGFKLRDGSVQITVPDVPPRDDYLIVLFGDSGNSSPTFAITKISGGGGGGGSSSSSPNVAPTSSTLITDPIPITGTTITGGTSTDLPTTTTVSSTTPSTTPIASSSTTGGTAAGANTTQTSGTSSISRGGAWGLTACMALAALFILL